VTLWRHVRAIGLLPGVVTVLVPALILWGGDDISVGWGWPGALAALPILAGAALIAGGLTLMVWTVRLFATIGHGTLAPWDPPTHLVVRGPYRHLRHPMITGVLCVLLGEAALLGSPPLLAWFAAALAINAVYLPLVEEPDLIQRFGSEYETYRAHVPRWLPRRRPWEPGAGNPSTNVRKTPV
jgi:protein-S-isoprenylcysteine O-methyltransferase Ste14